MKTHGFDREREYAPPSGGLLSIMIYFGLSNSFRYFEKIPAIIIMEFKTSRIGISFPHAKSTTPPHYGKCGAHLNLKHYTAFIGLSDFF